MIHRFKPDLIGNFDLLNPEDIRVNCTKAFDAAATLGVPKLIAPDEMVIMMVPDKIAVTSYVYNLRAALTGQAGVGHNRSSLASPWSASVFQPEESSGRESGSTNSESPAIEERRKSPASVKSTNSVGKREKSPSPNDQRPLMTRNQLMNPFDSDGEDGHTPDSVARRSLEGKPTSEQVATSPTSPTPVATPASTPIDQAVNGNGSEIRYGSLNAPNRPTLTPLIGSGPGDRQENLKRRARMLLQQFQTDDRRSSNDVLSPEVSETGFILRGENVLGGLGMNHPSIIMLTVSFMGTLK